MKCLACGERLYAPAFRSRTDANGGSAPLPATKQAVVIIERLRSIGKAAETPTLGDLRRALGNISEVPDDAELSLQVSGVLDSNVLVNWDAEAPRALDPIPPSGSTAFVPAMDGDVEPALLSHHGIGQT